MEPAARTRGFTVTELMIVTTLIGIRAMISTATVQNLSKHAEAAAFVNDGRVFAEAFNR
jgi:prepilin-type N-terminal cleavage/methylation domain-containing protein